MVSLCRVGLGLLAWQKWTLPAAVRPMPCESVNPTVNMFSACFADCQVVNKVAPFLTFFRGRQMSPTPDCTLISIMCDPFVWELEHGIPVLSSWWFGEWQAQSHLLDCSKHDWGQPFLWYLGITKKWALKHIYLSRANVDGEH